MNKKIFAITSILTLFSFSSLLYAQEVSTYSFSGFGGGLPSSATIVEATAAPENLSASTAVKETSKVLITSLIVGGVIVVGGIVLVATMSTEGGKEFMAECAGETIEQCMEDCMEETIDVCIQETCSDAGLKYIMPIYVP